MVRGSGASTEVSPTMPKFTYWESLTPEPPNLIGAVEPRIPHTIGTLSSRPPHYVINVSNPTGSPKL